MEPTQPIYQLNTLQLQQEISQLRQEFVIMRSTVQLFQQEITKCNNELSTLRDVLTAKIDNEIRNLYAKVSYNFEEKK